MGRVGSYPELRINTNTGRVGSYPELRMKRLRTRFPTLDLVSIRDRNDGRVGLPLGKNALRRGAIVVAVVVIERDSL